MDVATAKTLVSALLVCAIAAFSIYSVRVFLAEVSRDLRDARARQAAAEPRRLD